MTAAKAASKKTTKATKVEKKPVAKAAEKPVKETKETKVAPKAAPKAEVKKAPVKAAEKPASKAKPAGEKTLKSLASKKGEPVAHGVGRRKAAVARVWLRRGGNGTLTVNARPAAEYFTTEVARKLAQTPFATVPAIATRYNYDANVVGGGIHGQADAVKLAISRALLKADETSKPALKEQGLLTVDARVVERKKYGRKKARRRFQFVKR